MLCDSESDVSDCSHCRVLEPMPVSDSEPISVQGRLHEHADFWLNELEASTVVKLSLRATGYLFLNCPGQCLNLIIVQHWSMKN